MTILRKKSEVSCFGQCLIFQYIKYFLNEQTCNYMYIHNPSYNKMKSSVSYSYGFGTLQIHLVTDL